MPQNKSRADAKGARAKTGLVAAKDAEPAAKEKEALEVEFKVDTSKPLGMTIEKATRRSKHPALVTKLVPGGQAEKAGVTLGLHIRRINGKEMVGYKIKAVLALIGKAKKAKEPLVIVLVPEPDNARAARAVANAGRNAQPFQATK